MMLIFSFASVLLLLASRLARSQECDQTVQTPISLPVRDVTLAGQNVRRGLELRIGTPPQPLAIAVSGYYNNTYLYDQSPQCGSLPTESCIAIRGGAYDEAASSSLSTSLKLSDFSDLDLQAGITADTALTGSDTLTLNNSLVLEEFPIVIPRTDQFMFLDFSQLGMGKDSSLLTMLRNQGSIASRSFSLFWGQTGIDPSNQLDGNLVVGGLDEAKVSGNNYTTRLNHGSACPSGMLLSVSDMSLEFPNGTSASIMAAEIGQSVNYCIAPEYPIITMNQAQWLQWMQAHPQSLTDGNPSSRAGGFPNLWGLVYPPSLMFDGDLKITLSQSLSITIPNHQLVQSYYTFDDEGDITVNDTVLELMINPLTSTNQNDLPKFGMTFLQAAYLHVNYDEDTFTLWQANPTTQQSLIGVGKSTRGCASASSNTTDASGATASDSSTSSSTQGSQSSSSLSQGAIAGIALSCIAFVSALLGGLWYIRRRRRRQAATSMEAKSLHSSYYSSGSDPHRISAPMYNKSELDASSSSAVVTGGIGAAVQVREEWRGEGEGGRWLFADGRERDGVVAEMPGERYD